MCIRRVGARRGCEGPVCAASRVLSKDELHALFIGSQSAQLQLRGPSASGRLRLPSGPLQRHQALHIIVHAESPPAAAPSVPVPFEPPVPPPVPFALPGPAEQPAERPGLAYQWPVPEPWPEGERRWRAPLPDLPRRPPRANPSRKVPKEDFSTESSAARHKVGKSRQIRDMPISLCKS